MPASGSTSLPLSGRNDTWDAGKAQASLKPDQFEAAHFWRDGPADQISSYKLPFAENRDGTLTAVWRGVTAGAARLNQTEGIDEAAVQRRMGAYYDKAEKQYDDPSIEPPWESKSEEAAENKGRSAPMLPSVERRSVELTKAEFREQSDKMIFEGRAAVFGEKATIAGQFVEQIKRGAFRKSDVSETVFALNHNYDLVMARSWVTDGPGMLQLDEGTRGLDVYAELAPTQTARDTRTLVETGVIRQMSFAWPAGAAVDDWNGDYTERTITEFKKVLDVSPVVFPAYAGTQASTRSLVDALAESFRPDLPAAERVAAFAAILGTINPESPLAAEITGRALSQASAELLGAASLAEELAATAHTTGRRAAVAALDMRLIDRRLRLRGVTP